MPSANDGPSSARRPAHALNCYESMVGEVRGKLCTFHRWMAKGFFFGCEEIEGAREMMFRLKAIEQHFEQLVAASR